MKLWVSGVTTFYHCVIKAHGCFYLCSQGSESGDGQTRESQEGEDQSKSNQTYEKNRACPGCACVMGTSPPATLYCTFKASSVINSDQTSNPQLFASALLFIIFLNSF